MPQPNFRSVALHLLLLFVGATGSFCVNPADLSIESLLQKGIDLGYPGIVVLMD